jgi:phenylalanyl-tRNA synthetase beta chain
MRAPVSWVAEHVELPAGTTPRQVGDALVRVGLEVERVESAADGLSGPIVVGRVITAEAEPQKNGKTINWCSVDVGSSNGADGPRGIVCGAHNFGPGDLVVVALPGAVLPGPFAISARKTYGHLSDGMICSVRELGIGEDHDGILVLPSGSAEPGDDALDVLGLRDAVLDIAVTPDRGYCLSVRGLAREAAAAFGTRFTDITATGVVGAGEGYPARVEDPAGCDQFSLRAVRELDPTRPSPDWMRARLRASGIRSISLVVDVTNYVMIETGQPLHAYDRARLVGAIGVRRARSGESVTTLDGTVRRLVDDDLVITDDSGPIGLAGVMGGASTEITATTTDIVLEAAHFDPRSIARAVRRHKLPSEAARRFERGIDPRIAALALQRCVDLLVEHGGAQAEPGLTVIGSGPAPTEIVVSAARPGATAGMPISADTVRRRLAEVGCEVDPELRGDGELLHVIPPSWRPDLVDPADLVEEVVRLEGYDRIPSALPVAPPGRGITPSQRLRRDVSRALGGAGAVEVLTSPFVSPEVHDVFGLAADDPRRQAARVVNPLNDAEPELRTSLLPGLLASVVRNTGRGNRELALFEMGLVTHPTGRPSPVPRPGVAHRPSDAEVAALEATVPPQPRHVAVVLSGELERAGWWGPGRTATWADAIEFARVVGRAARAPLQVRRAEYAPWHPGRCAEVLLEDRVVGHAGELHPQVVAALGLPERTAAMELDLDAFAPPEPASAPELSTFPPVLLDVALVVDEVVAAADVLRSIEQAAGPLLESVRLFDVYVGDQLPAGQKSLAFALRLRAADRTLTVEEATAARDAAVQEAARTVGARLRS